VLAATGRARVVDGAADADAWVRRSDVLLLLGSEAAVYDPARVEVVRAEQALVRSAVAQGTAVLAICYGAQLAASALGAGVRGVERGEVGWFEVSSRDEALCPPGPWLQFHSDVLDVPEGARLLGSSPVGPQGFALDRGVRGVGGVVAWQFHPETTPGTLRRWAGAMPGYVRAHGADPDAVVAEAERRAESSRAAAHRLVDAALAHLAVPSGDERLPAR
jgi:GMP synthase-like glutamine amidotransferase